MCYSYLYMCAYAMYISSIFLYEREEKGNVNEKVFFAQRKRLKHNNFFKAVRLLNAHRVHRLCIVQRALANTVLCILEQHRVLEFLREQVRIHRSLYA